MHKRVDNSVVLVFKCALPENFKIEASVETTVHFMMTTRSTRLRQDPFEITTPVIINLGTLKSE